MYRLFSFLFFCTAINTSTNAMLKNMMKYPFYNQNNLIITHGKKIILVGGCFDILHHGHIQFLEKARKCGDYLIVALEPDKRIIDHKKRLPVHNQKERAYNLSALKSVDSVVMLPLLNGFDDYLDLVKTIQPHVIAITHNDPQLENKQKQADLIGAQLIIATPRIEPFSSSAIYHQD